MNELKPCPFCGGNGKVSFKDYRYIGHNGVGDKKLIYRVQIICNKCRGRGKPIITDGLINPNPYISKWGNCYSGTSVKCQRATDMFAPYVNQAIEVWNRRVGESNE